MSGRVGRWAIAARFMGAVCGAALLLQRHPTWTVQQVKSALASTGDAVHPTGRSGEVSVLRQGGGRIDLERADQPLIFTAPTSLGWGLVGRGFSGTKHLSTSDAGGGSAPWSVSIHTQSVPQGAKLEPLAETLVAGTTLGLRLTVSQQAAAGDGTGFVVLTRGADVRRVAFWFHVEVPRLRLDPHRTLHRPGLYHGNTAGKASRVSSYRYPQRGLAQGVPTRLGGPEQVFRFALRRHVANFGAAIIRRARGVRVSPRLVAGSDENRVVGYTGMPVSLNPYQGFDRAQPIVGAVLPEPGTYELVFDTPTRAKPGAFTFRFWVNDTSPPSIRLLGHTGRIGRPIRVAVRDSGSGVDPRSLQAKVGGRSASSSMDAVRAAPIRTVSAVARPSGASTRAATSAPARHRDGATAHAQWSMTGPPPSQSAPEPIRESRNESVGASSRRVSGFWTAATDTSGPISAAGPAP